MKLHNIAPISKIMAQGVSSYPFYLFFFYLTLNVIVSRKTQQFNADHVFLMSTITMTLQLIVEPFSIEHFIFIFFLGCVETYALPYIVS